MENKILTPWRMYAEYEDGTGFYFPGFTEEDCMCRIANAQDRHGDCTFYTGVSDDNYYDGQLCLEEDEVVK